MVDICDNVHLGQLIMDHMLKRPNAICQIDAGTGKSETNASVLSRSIRLAKSLRNFGAAPGDILALHGVNHIDLAIPFYAALLNGLTIVGVDPLYKFEEIKKLFKISTPKIAFCQCEHFLDVVKELELDTKVVTFNEGKHSMHNFILEHEDEDEKEFRPAEFDTEKIYAWLICTSGTTGMVKLAAFKHKPWIDKILLRQPSFLSDNPKNRPALNLSPVQWISSFFNRVSMPLYNLCMVQTSLPVTTDHLIDIINEYRPVTAVIGPAILNSLLKHEKICDFTSFDTIKVTGGKVHKDLICELRKRTRDDAIAAEVYGQTETLGQVFSLNAEGPLGSCGKPTTVHQVKLIDPDSEEEIKSVNIPGELWVKGPLFSEYYNNPVATAEAITDDGWFRTGDLLYRDDKDNYYFVERREMLIRYRNYHIAPLELVAVIRQHPGVLDVSVTSVPNVFDGEHPVACVVRRSGCQVTAREIKELVANKLSYSKRLRGGVIFMERLPRTSTGKVARAKIKQIALIAYRE